MGKFSWYCSHNSGIYTILSTNLYHLSSQESWEPEHPNDVHTNTRKLRLGFQFSLQTWPRRMECMGNLRGDWLFAGDIAGHGKLF